jgi:hypothetical protein
MSAPTSAPSPPRSTRPLAARKRPNDPAWFSSAPSAPSVKRQATDRVESEQRKRKRVEPTVQGPSQLGPRIDRPQEKQNEEQPVVSVLLSFLLVWWAGKETRPSIHQHLSVTRGDSRPALTASSFCNRWTLRPCRWKLCTGIWCNMILYRWCIHHR